MHEAIINSFSTIYKISMLPVLSILDPDADAIAKLLKTFSEENSLLKLVINEPNEFRGKNLGKYIESLPWDDMLFTKSFESSLARGLQIVLCRIRNNKLAIVSRSHLHKNAVFFFCASQKN